MLVAQVADVGLHPEPKTLEVRIQELIDGRADGDDHRLAALQPAGIGGQRQAPLGEDPLQDRFRPLFQERHLALGYGVDGLFVQVDGQDVQTVVGQEDCQRQSYVAGAAHDADIDRFPLREAFQMGVHGFLPQRVTSDGSLLRNIAR